MHIGANGTVIKAVPDDPGVHDNTYYGIVRFRDGYLFLDFWDARIFQLDANLALAPQPFATLPGSDTWPTGIVWLHQQP